MKRLTLINIVAGFSAIMMTVSLVTLFVCTSDEQLMFTTCSFIGWGMLGSILICSQK